MYAEIRPDLETDWGAMARVAELLGISTAETVRKWVRQAESTRVPGRGSRARSRPS